MKSDRYDVVIVGAGVVGCAIARELSRYPLNICVLESQEDVCSGTSKANSGIVHAGFDAKPGTNKARMNVEGNRMMERLSRELDFSFCKNGSLVVCFDEAQLPQLEALKEQGEKNGVQGLEVLSREALLEREPNLSEDVAAGLYASDGGIVCPFEMTAALAENACQNGAEFCFLERVEGIERTEGGYRIRTEGGQVDARFVVNAAGVYADELHNMVSARRLSITPRRGSYQLLDKVAGGHVRCTVFQLPGAYGKGVLVTPTVHGNLLIGPTAVDVEDKEGTDTSREELEAVAQKSAKSVKNIPYRTVITSFAGLRAHEAGGDFVLGEPEDAPGFFDAAGIESPGLTSAPAIGVYLARQIASAAGVVEKAGFISTRKGIVRAAALSAQERAALIAQNAAYGRIVCRCEEISEGEILEAIHRTPGAVSLDGVKRRVRAGMGRCQAGFCMPGVIELLARELGIRTEEICKNVPGSELLLKKEGLLKGGFHEDL